MVRTNDNNFQVVEMHRQPEELRRIETSETISLAQKNTLQAWELLGESKHFSYIGSRIVYAPRQHVIADQVDRCLTPSPPQKPSRDPAVYITPPKNAHEHTAPVLIPEFGAIDTSDHIGHGKFKTVRGRKYINTDQLLKIAASDSAAQAVLALRCEEREHEHTYRDTRPEKIRSAHTGSFKKPTAIDIKLTSECVAIIVTKSKAPANKTTAWIAANAQGTEQPEKILDLSSKSPQLKTIKSKIRHALVTVHSIIPNEADIVFLPHSEAHAEMQLINALVTKGVLGGDRATDTWVNFGVNKPCCLGCAPLMSIALDLLTTGELTERRDCNNDPVPLMYHTGATPSRYLAPLSKKKARNSPPLAYAEVAERFAEMLQDRAGPTTHPARMTQVNHTKAAKDLEPAKSEIVPAPSLQSDTTDRSMKPKSWADIVRTSTPFSGIETKPTAQSPPAVVKPPEPDQMRPRMPNANRKKVNK